LANALQLFSFELVLNDTKENIDNYVSGSNITLPGNLTIHPRQKDVTQFYNRASLVVNLSNRNLFIETFGLTALEAMTAGLPVIVPTVGGIAEMVTDGVNGYKIDVQNLKEIEETVKSVLTNKDLYLSLASNSLDSSKKYGTAHLIDSIEKILCSGCTSK
jgi:glycosyltransferase involved in cell wall biosynthesis